MEISYSKRLEELEKRFRDLEHLLSDPKIISNPEEYKKLSKERAGLLPAVEIYDLYKKALSDIFSNKELLLEKDSEIQALARGELSLLETRKIDLEEKIKVLLLPKDLNEEKNILLEIRAGTGGDEASLFAADLFRMYSRYAESRGWKVEVLNTSWSDVKGLKEIIAGISGERVYSFLKYESGVHRVQRVPKTEAMGRVHTSTVTVAVLAEADEVEVDIKPADLKIDVFRSSGPGGQSVNTTDSAVRMTHIPTGVQVSCQDEKSQHKNKAKALKILRTRLFEMERQKQEKERARDRKSQVGSGDRSEKIRTYNFPQSRMTDHRIGFTVHNLEEILNGKIHGLILALQSHFQKKALEENQ